MRRLSFQRESPTRKLCASFLFAVLLFVCGSAIGQKKDFKSKDWREPLSKAPATAGSWTNPYAGQPDAVLAGQRLFRRHCTECHGEDARGGSKAPDLRSAAVQQAPPGVLFWFLRNGNLRAGMPSWSRLPDPQRWQLVSYLKSLGPSADPSEDSPASRRLSH